MIWDDGEWPTVPPYDDNEADEVVVVVRAGLNAEIPSAVGPAAQIIAGPRGASIAELRRLGVTAATADIVRFRLVSGARQGGDGKGRTAPSCPRLSVVLPVSNGESTLVPVLDALAKTDLPSRDWELVVVDDCSVDATVAVAAAWADIIVRVGGRAHGPAYARNRGVEFATGEIVAFIDADICVEGNTLSRILDFFSANPDVAAVSGTHDGKAADRGLISRYRDVMTLFRHERLAGDTDRFWADCGAVRRLVFVDVGGYNEWHFVRPQVEALDLGYRLRQHGHRIVLRPDIQVGHLKRWTPLGWLAAEVLDQALPANRLWGSGRGTPQRRAWWRSDRVAATMAWTSLGSVVAWAVVGSTWLGILAGTLAGVGLLTELPVVAFLARRCGPWVAIGSLPLHFIHHLAGGAGALLGSILRHSIGDPSPSPSVQALSEVGVEKWPPVPRRADLPGLARSADPPEPGH